MILAKQGIYAYKIKIYKEAYTMLTTNVLAQAFIKQLYYEE